MTTRLIKTISSVEIRATFLNTIVYKTPDSTTLTASKGVDKALTDLVAPLVYCFIGHINLPRSKQILDIEVTQGKMVIPPDGVTDDCVGIEVT